MKEYLKESALALALHFINLLLILFYVIGHTVFLNLWLVFPFILVTVAAIACVKKREERRKADVVNLVLTLLADVIFVGFYAVAITGTLKRMGI